MKSIFMILLCSLLLTVAGCASQRPLLYPNDYLKKVGKEQAQKDIDAAMKEAEEYNLESSDVPEKAGKTAENTAVKAGTGAAVGAISGDPLTSAATGAVGGASHGVLSWIFGAHKPPAPYKKFVETYLKKKGYEVIGWD